jgi:hypothetical protein
MQCSQPYPSSVQRIGKRTIETVNLHQHFEFGPASQDPFSFCQIQLTLNTVYREFGDYSMKKSKKATEPLIRASALIKKETKIFLIYKEIRMDRLLSHI